MEFASAAGNSMDAGDLLNLTDLDAELNEIIAKAHSGEAFDESRLDFLVNKRSEHPEVIAQKELAREIFLQENMEFMESCYTKMLSFVPADVHKTDEEALKESYGLTSDVARRIKRKQCLWLIRMQQDDLAKIHESDLFARYVIQGQSLDIVEMSAIYMALPDTFKNDTKGIKAEWKAALEGSLFKMLEEMKANTLPAGKTRHSAYKDSPEMGPIEDLTAMRVFNTVIGTDVVRPRRSFVEVCGEHSILSKRSSRQLAFEAEQKKKIEGVKHPGVADVAEGDGEDAGDLGTVGTSLDAGIDAAVTIESLAPTSEG